MGDTLSCLALLLSGLAAHADTPILLPEIITTGERPNVEAAKTASEFDVPGENINAVAITRPGEALEQAPGLIVSQHSGEGKANQYFLRGFNLDHGTDLAISIDGMPVNARTHGHGQGYADINFLIPELIASMKVRKGPYFADEGDFSSAGAVHIDLLDRMNPGLAQVTGGSFGYARSLTAKSVKTGEGHFLTAFEATTYDGPWELAEKMRKFNGLMRYSQGDAQNGFTVTAMAYDNRWRSTDQIPLSAVTSGQIGRYGNLDPTDGGNSSRYSLSSRFNRTTDSGHTQIDSYVIRSTMNLFSNFTFFLNNNNPGEGDQFKQLDERTVFGMNASHTFKGMLGAAASETKFGVQTRYDDIDNGLFSTIGRVTWDTTRKDNVREGSAGLYAQNTTRWTDWLRTVAGVRGDWFSGIVRSDNPLNSGNASDFIASPKGTIVFGPFRNTEFFLSGGTGFHSNDLRGVTITVDPASGNPADKVPFLVRSKGGEVGVRSRIGGVWDTSVAVFILDYDSELLFVGDAGTTEASRPSRRTGVEWANHYRPFAWLGFDFDFAWTRARFTDFSADGDHIPGAPAYVASAGVLFGQETGWFGGARFRYFGPRPLIEDNSVRSSETALVNARLGYRFDNGARIQLDVLNLLDAKANQIEYFYESRPQQGGAAIEQRHFHPVEPRAFRLTAATKF